jgi:hypothetical protein
VKSRHYGRYQIAPVVRVLLPWVSLKEGRNMSPEPLQWIDRAGTHHELRPASDLSQAERGHALCATNIKLSDWHIKVAPIDSQIVCYHCKRKYRPGQASN